MNSNNNSKEISDIVKRVLNNIKEKDYTDRELLNYYNNIISNKTITEYEKEVLIDQLEKTLRAKHPKRAKKMFGSKDAAAREILKGILSELTEEYEWSNNKVGSHVKVGGDQINGTSHVCAYISYKNMNAVSSELAYKQSTVDSEPFLEVLLRQVRSKEKETEIIENKSYSVESVNEACAHFKKNLSTIIS